jgi:uncharacterized membrane protein YdjX (TVP38/TMEM64 family)
MVYKEEEKVSENINTGSRERTGGGGAGGILQKAALLVWAALIIAAIINRDRISAESILSYTPENMLAAAAMIMGFFALKTLSIVFYSGLLFTVSGMLFGMPAAIAVNIAGALVMLLEGYAVGRAGGRKLVEDLTAKYPRFGEFTGLKDSRPFAFALLIRMLKFVNYDLGSMFMGASEVPLLPYLGGSLVAMLPEIVLFALAGSGISDMNAVPAIWAAVIYAAMTILSALILKRMMKQQTILDTAKECDKLTR